LAIQREVKVHTQSHAEALQEYADEVEGKLADEKASKLAAVEKRKEEGVYYEGARYYRRKDVGEESYV
jgi:hypothetical protein